MKLTTLFVLLLIVASCRMAAKKTPVNDIPFGDTSHLPVDSLAFYFPANSFSEKPSSDSFVQNWYSSALYSFKEPVLSQGFIGHNVYRFLWLRSFHRPVVLTLHQNGTQVWLNTKMLNRQPRFYDNRIDGISKNEIEDYTKEGFVVDKKDPDLLVRIADRKASVIYNNRIVLTEKEWNDFEQLLRKAQFWTLPSRIDDGSSDGAQWIFEAHLNNKYHVVDYHSPFHNEYEKAGLFLIKLSGLKEEVY